MYTYDLSPWLGVLNSKSCSGINHTITVEVTGAAGSDWVLANTLLLWRDKNSTVVSGERPVMVMSQSMSEPVGSVCEGASVKDIGTCVVKLDERVVVAGASLRFGDVDYAAFVSYKMHHYSNSISYNNIDGSVSWRQLTSHEASWFMGHLQREYPFWSASSKNRYGAGNGQLQSSNLRQALHAYMSAQGSIGTLTRTHTLFDWLNAGGIEDGATFEFSDNMTMVMSHKHNALGSPHIGSNSEGNFVHRQQHYQRLLMMDVYNTSKPACVVPPYPTHTVSLNTTITSRAHAPLCVCWQAACAFCSPELMVDSTSVCS